jgi:hypothetical protein
MKSANYAIQVIPDLSIDRKYSSIIDEAANRIDSFTSNALRDNRVGELFHLDKTGMEEVHASRVLNGEGRVVVGFQFDKHSDTLDDNFSLFVKKLTPSGRAVKFHLTPTVQEIMLQLISLEDRRTVSIFSMLNSSMEIGYQILTAMYGSQLNRLVSRVPSFLKDEITGRMERIAVATSSDESDLWKEHDMAEGAGPRSAPQEERPGSQDNILQVMVDESTFAELNQYVEDVVTRAEHIKEKRRWLEENPDIPKDRIYEEMIREDLDQLENCYARIHIYLRAFYKKKDRRSRTRNKILRQFFGAEIEAIMAETGLLEDLLSLNQEAYFKNIERH